MGSIRRRFGTLAPTSHHRPRQPPNTAGRRDGGRLPSGARKGWKPCLPHRPAQCLVERGPAWTVCRQGMQGPWKRTAGGAGGRSRRRQAQRPRPPLPGHGADAAGVGGARPSGRAVGEERAARRQGRRAPQCGRRPENTSAPGMGTIRKQHKNKSYIIIKQKLYQHKGCRLQTPLHMKQRAAQTGHARSSPKKGRQAGGQDRPWAGEAQDRRQDQAWGRSKRTACVSPRASGSAISRRLMLPRPLLYGQRRAMPWAHCLLSQPGTDVFGISGSKQSHHIRKRHEERTV